MGAFGFWSAALEWSVICFYGLPPPHTIKLGARSRHCVNVMEEQGKLSNCIGKNSGSLNSDHSVWIASSLFNQPLCCPFFLLQGAFLLLFLS